MHQAAFEEIKNRLLKLSILHIKIRKVDFNYSKTLIKQQQD